MEIGITAQKFMTMLKKRKIVMDILVNVKNGKWNGDLVVNEFPDALNIIDLTKVRMNMRIMFKKLRFMPFCYVLFAMLGMSGCIHFGIVGPDDFLSLRPGMSLADVRVRLGSSKLHHHFTVERGGHMWQLFRCYLSADHAQRDILFRDGRFVKHVDVTRAVSFRTIRDDNWAGGLFVFHGVRPITPMSTRSSARVTTMRHVLRCVGMLSWRGVRRTDRESPP